jgi:hypothetical protein
MKVSSPVGDFPFAPDRVRVEGTRLTLEGKMGAWPARVEMEPADALRFARLLGPRLAAPVIGALIVGAALRRRSNGAG